MLICQTQDAPADLWLGIIIYIYVAFYQVNDTMRYFLSVMKYGNTVVLKCCIAYRYTH